MVDDAHAETIRKLGTILGLEITVRASEDLNREQASDVEVFQDRLPVPDATAEGPLLLVAADCKGVPLVRKALPPDEETDTPLPSMAHRHRYAARARRRTGRRWRTSTWCRRIDGSTAKCGKLGEVPGVTPNYHWRSVTAACGIGSCGPLRQQPLIT